MRFLFSIILAIFVFSVFGQQSYLKVNYTVNAALDGNSKVVNGDWHVKIINQSDSAITTIWIQLYPNAFASDTTTFSEDLLKWGKTDFYFAKKSDYGFIDSLHFDIEGDANAVSKVDNFGELMSIHLTKPLLVNDSLQLNSTFYTQLPYNYFKNGYKGNDYVVNAWMPLVAHIDRNGWDKSPYSIFRKNKTSIGDFDVQISVPSNIKLYTDATQNENGHYVLVNADHFVWQAISTENEHTINPELFKDGIPKSSVATKLYPFVFQSRRQPKDTIEWLGRVYRQYHRPIPYIDDSLFYLRKSDSISQSLKLGFLYDFRNTANNKYIFLSPAIGFNNYDKLMAGILIHNYQLPRQAFNFALAPMYTFGSKSLAGGGHIGYNIWTRKTHWEFAASGLTYSWRDFDVSPYPKFFQRMTRIVPSVNLTVFDKDVNASKRWDFTFRSFLIREQNYSQFVSGNDTSFGNVSSNTTLFQLKAGISDDRKLCPYSVNATVDQGKEFIRLGVTGKYFFNYDANNKGVSARFFAGKFFYLSQYTQSLSNVKYDLSLSGSNGDNDYTYSNYFIGRHEDHGWMSQQMMERDGFFKISTLRLNGFGLSDNWMSALNLIADIPDKLNPLTVLPFKQPLKLFFDVGTYAALWEDVPPAGRFLYDFGIQIPLFKSLVNVYVPLLYSKVFRDTYKSNIPKNYFWRTISFNIDLSLLQNHFKGF